MAKPTSKRISKTDTNEEPAKELAIVYETVQVVHFFSSGLPAGSPTSVNYSTEVTYQIDDRNQALSVVVQIEGRDANGKLCASEALAGAGGVLFGLAVRSMYRLVGLGNLPRRAKREFELPGWVLASAISGAVGTTRGILTQKLSGTPFADVIPPLVSLNALLPGKSTNGLMNHGI